MEKLTPSIFATAYIKGRNLRANVEPHINNRYFANLDLKDFFPSIKIERVFSIFKLIGYSTRNASILSKLCTYNRRLPQGAVTSPCLSNLVAAKLDRRIYGYTSRRRIIYTRYADDITLSSNNPNLLVNSLQNVYEIIYSEKFDINFEKFRIIGPRRKCVITGLVKNSCKSEFNIGKSKKRQMRIIMYNLSKNIIIDKNYTNRSAIEGWLSFLMSVDKNSYKQMSNYWSSHKGTVV